MLFFNNTSESSEPSMHTHYVPLIIALKNANNKANRKLKLQSLSTSNLYSKMPFDKSFLKAFLNNGLPDSKGKLNKNTLY